MLNLVFVESALETIPRELWTHKSIVRWAKRFSKTPRGALLDRSYHHRSMLTLRKSFKRGRPDILHLSLLEALGAPLNKEGLLRTYIHTFHSYLIYVNSQTRLPKNYNRFVGLMEALFERGKVPNTGSALLTLKKGNLKHLLDVVKPTYIVAFSRLGTPKELEEIIDKITNIDDSMILVGAFPKGHLEDETIQLAHEVFSIDMATLDTSIVTSRIIYEYEKGISLTKKRLRGDR